jgi:predicted enzyme related to lactoylglutathione lyase
MTAHLASKLVFYDIPASDLDASRKFYEALLGADNFPPAPAHPKSFFHPISPDGIDLTLHQKRDQDPPDIPIAYFAVDDIDVAIKELEARGGKVVYEKNEIPLPTGRALQQFTADAKKLKLPIGKRLGEAVTMLDPDSNPVGIVRLEPAAAHYFHAGQFIQPLRADQVAGVRRALEAEPA